MEELAFDWLYELEQRSWERRIRELKQELATQRLLLESQKLVAQEEVSQKPQEVEPMQPQPQQLQLKLEEVALPSPLQMRQKLIRLVKHS